MKLQTSRLTLREMGREDYDALFAVWGDGDVMRHYPYRFDEERVRQWIENNLERYRVLGFGLWAAELRESGRLIGDCGLTMQNIHGRICPEIGYHIHRDFQRQGYGREAARACRDWAFENTPFQVLYSYMVRENRPSAAVAAANGMTLTDRYRDDLGRETLVYAITRQQWTEWKRQNKRT